jgi:hypothetical protein
MTKTEVINKLTPIIDNLANEHDWITGKEAMVMAQILIESNWLKATHQGNCLGIKWTPKQPESRKQMLWTKEYVNGKYISVLAPFMTYPSIEDCIESGYIKTLSLARYKQTRESKDWWEATNYIRLNGYATSISYTNTLRNMVLSHKLYELDWQHAYNEPIFPGFNFTWGETFGNVYFNGKKYYRVIEPYPEYWDNVESLAIQLQIVRFHFGKPMKVESWFRIRDYNSYIGGSAQSQHLTANAADVVRNSNMADFLKAFEDKTDVTGIGIMKNGLHVDKRPGKRIYWTY